MRYAGIDIGSRTVKLAVIEDGRLVLSRKSATSHNPLGIAHELMEGVDYDRLTATGYGRHLIKGHLDCPVVSEITAFVRGSRFFSNDCESILDIGGQDTKAISLDKDGNLCKFEMNDRCAAGTGRFLEVMATVLGFTLEEFSLAALSAKRAEKINSMCTVFAESEVVSLVTQGADRNEVALGIHKAIISRAAGLLKRVAPSGKIFFAGGVALNGCARSLLEQETDRPVFVPPDPQIVGAVGAALVASENS
ncbi:putative CoA-substrate-specific enzyme activase [Methanoregula boonei 6A8]|uniref:Putative CoA-substrate-specific enzyme activase n=1 Tax=Methanoregula boonei (strain DSM 21154 / JCM 14090 / 6A8) TaxID=456442 RepID=A7I6M1_METB6|nr:acyl-CoA dehydratase activase [Methanoregula boonei]ABS55382.1 putative CoA-substrate-specific enzyme activase [Methanoregula boonei 6A8]